MEIEVDGGLGPETVSKAVNAGANMIVAGSSVFNNDPKSSIFRLRRLIYFKIWLTIRVNFPFSYIVLLQKMTHEDI